MRTICRVNAMLLTTVRYRSVFKPIIFTKYVLARAISRKKIASFLIGGPGGKIENGTDSCVVTVDHTHLRYYHVGALLFRHIWSSDFPVVPLYHFINTAGIRFIMLYRDSNAVVQMLQY